jgi:hypothetical protein
MRRSRGLALALALTGCTQPNPRFDGDSPSVHDDGAVDGGKEIPGVDAGVSSETSVTDVGQIGPAPTDAPGASGLILYWRFDEQTGTVATDSSGGGIDGAYLGEPTLPQPASAVAPTGFANPLSREFPATGRPSVRASGAMTILKLQPTDQFTLSVWYRATTASAAFGGDLINLSDATFIRLKPNQIEVGRRREVVTPPVYAVAENDQLTNALDGRWHHVAGVIGGQSVSLYFDGVMKATTAEPRPLVYMGRDVVVGRHDNTQAEQQFQGAIDEVRIYRRALTAQEVLNLAQGGRVP